MDEIGFGALAEGYGKHRRRPARVELNISVRALRPHGDGQDGGKGKVCRHGQVHSQQAGLSEGAALLKLALIARSAR
jgi:hypothetical protein